MKNKLMLILGALLIVVLAACGSDNQDNNTGNTNDVDGETTLSFYTWINEENGNWEEVINAFEEEHPEIKIDLKVLVENMSFSDYIQQLDLQAAAGDKMDIVMFSNSRYLADRIPAGMIAPLNSHIDDEELDINDEYDMGAVPPASDGTYYGLPAKFNSYFVMLNKDHLDEAGLPIPTDWTWEDYREYAKELTTDERFGSLFRTPTTDNFYMRLLGKSEENFLIKEDGTSNIDDPMIEESLKLRFEMEQEDKTSEQYATIISQNLDYRQQFFTETASMMPIASYMITEWGDFVPDFEIAYAPYPKNDENEESYVFTTADVMSIAQSSDHKEEAYTFMRWMTSEGMLIQGKSLPSWNKADTVVDDLVANTSKPEAVHVESLKHSLEHSESAQQFLPPAYLSEIADVFHTEVEMYFLKEQDLETTLENAKKEIQSVIDANQN